MSLFIKDMTIVKVIDEILKRAPYELQLDYDNSGLQVGDVNQKLRNIVVTLDIDESTIKKAVKNKANLIISHHPLIFSAIKRIDPKDSICKKIITAIKNDICIYSCHTNFDSAYGGLNDILAELLEIDKLIPLSNHEDSSLCKLVVLVPIGYEERVKDSLFSVGAGVIGDYSHCAFSQKGEGTFVAHDSSTPFIGKKSSENLVDETRIEMVIPRQLISKAVNELIKSHPYEEPAFDIYPLINKKAKSGIGRIGDLEYEVSLSELNKRVKDKLKIKHLRYIGKEKARINKVALCCGSGGSLIDTALNKGADVYITGDVKYHEARQAVQAGLNIIDAGHFSTEIIFVDYIKKYLTSFLKNNASVAKVFSEKAKDPFNII
jgi:dinuclear metal center YbgI/SA1388 family protein